MLCWSKWFSFLHPFNSCPRLEIPQRSWCNPLCQYASTCVCVCVRRAIGICVYVSKAEKPLLTPLAPMTIPRDENHNGTTFRKLFCRNAVFRFFPTLVSIWSLFCWRISPRHNVVGREWNGICVTPTTRMNARCKCQFNYLELDKSCFCEWSAFSDLVVSPDGRHTVHLDLWMHIWCFDSGNGSLLIRIMEFAFDISIVIFV